MMFRCVRQIRTSLSETQHFSSLHSDISFLFFLFKRSDSKSFKTTRQSYVEQRPRYHVSGRKFLHPDPHFLLSLRKQKSDCLQTHTQKPREPCLDNVTVLEVCDLMTKIKTAAKQKRRKIQTEKNTAQLKSAEIR